MGGRMIIITFKVKVADKLFGRYLEVSPTWSVCDGPPCLLVLRSTRLTAAGLKAGDSWKNKDERVLMLSSKHKSSQR